MKWERLTIALGMISPLAMQMCSGVYVINGIRFSADWLLVSPPDKKMRAILDGETGHNYSGNS